MPTDATRLLLAFIAVCSLGAISFAASTRSGVLAAEQAASTSSTLVPRPSIASTDGSLDGLADDDATVENATVDGAAPRTDNTSGDAADLDPTNGLAGRTTASTPVIDPYAWLEEVPTPGRTFIGVSTQTGALTEVDDFSESAGVSPDVVMISRGWADATADMTAVEQITAAGHLPLIAWEPWNFDVESTFDRRRGEQPDFALSTIIDGDHDELILDWAAALAEWNRPVAMRFAHEMNGYWYPWSESVNGNSPGQYVAAWRHVHGLFEDAGADDVIWIWSPNPTQPTLLPLEGLYPGDDYVDWIGIVGYLGNGIDPAVFVPTFDQLFGPTIDEIRALTDLPLVITEIGATEAGGQKAAWIDHVIGEIDRRDDVIGFVWFEVDKETDWRIVSSPEATAAFADAISRGDFGIPR